MLTSTKELDEIIRCIREAAEDGNSSVKVMFELRKLDYDVTYDRALMCHRISWGA